MKHSRLLLSGTTNPPKLSDTLQEVLGIYIIYDRKELCLIS